MEMAQRAAEAAGQLPADRRIGRNPRKDLWDKYRSFPTSSKEWEDHTTFFGLFESTNAPVQQRKKDTAVCIQGEITNIPNIWGDVKEGDTLGFKVKRVVNRATDLVNAYGKKVASPTVGEILQIVPHVESEGKKPNYVTNHENPSEQDIDFFEPTVIRQHEYAFSPDGSVMWDVPPSQDYSAFLAPVYRQGTYMELGQVVRRTVPQNPSPIDIQCALRTFDGWNNLARNDLTLDVEITGCPHMHL